MMRLLNITKVLFLSALFHFGCQIALQAESRAGCFNNSVTPSALIPVGANDPGVTKSFAELGSIRQVGETIWSGIPKGPRFSGFPGLKFKGRQIGFKKTIRVPQAEAVKYCKDHDGELASPQLFEELAAQLGKCDSRGFDPSLFPNLRGHRIWTSSPNQVFDGNTGELKETDPNSSDIALVCIRSANPTQTLSNPFDKIDHTVVVVMENRSFDHLFGFGKLDGFDPSGNRVSAHDMREAIDQIPDASRPTPDAPYLMTFDPPHEYWEVKMQLTNWATAPDATAPFNLAKYFLRAALTFVDGIDANQARDVLRGYTREQLPVMYELAENYAIADNWFSGIPGPTFPNRLYFHAGTSGGLVGSPNPEHFLLPNSQEFDMAAIAGFHFNNGSIFDRLTEKGIRWTVYHGDHLPQVTSIEGMMEKMLFGINGEFKSFREHFASDARSGNLPQYSFIEPRYGNLAKFTGGNSMHPVGDVRDGEEFLREIYRAVRNGRDWERTLLIVTFDEHGGFYDHVQPPAAHPTGDDDSYNTLDEEHGGRFDFKRLGLRVPTILVSPWIRKNTIIQNEFNHASVLKWLENKYQIKPLTERDQSAQSFETVLSLDSPRTRADEKQDDYCPKELSDPWKGVHRDHREKGDPKYVGLDNSFLHSAVRAEYHMIMAEKGVNGDSKKVFAEAHQRILSIKGDREKTAAYHEGLDLRIKRTHDESQKRRSLRQK